MTVLDRSPTKPVSTPLVTALTAMDLMVSSGNPAAHLENTGGAQFDLGKVSSVFSRAGDRGPWSAEQSEDASGREDNGEARDICRGTSDSTRSGFESTRSMERRRK